VSGLGLLLDRGTASFVLKIVLFSWGIPCRLVIMNARENTKSHRFQLVPVMRFDYQLLIQGVGYVRTPNVSRVTFAEADSC